MTNKIVDNMIPMNIKENYGNSALKLVIITYLDHVLYRNMSSKKVNLSMRETIGWITKQSEDAIWLIWDKPIDINENETDDHASGLVILRDTIQKMIEI